MHVFLLRTVNRRNSAAVLAVHAVSGHVDLMSLGFEEIVRSSRVGGVFFVFSELEVIVMTQFIYLFFIRM